MVLSVVFTILLAASKVSSTPTNTKSGYGFENNVQSKSTTLTQTWPGKESNTTAAIKDHNMVTHINAFKKSAVESGRSFSTPANGSIPSNTSCPTWTYPTKDETCECGDTLNGVIQCNISSHHLAIHSCNCMTYDNFTGNTVAGPCYHTCTYMVEPSDIYRSVPQGVYRLNNEMCGYLHRTGQLCGQCEVGYKQSAYFYTNKCVICDNTKYNGLKYIVAAFFPLTFFLLIVFYCRISVTSAQFNAFIFYSQIISVPHGIRNILNGLHGWSTMFVQIAATLYGIWNLDFFRTLFPGICLDLSSLQILTLDYVIALYPLLLMIIFYVLIEVHDSNCRPIVYMWKPFHKCLSRFRRQWNARTSIIDAFATFLLLSYTKLLWVSVDILYPTWVYDIQGKKVGLYLYYDASVKYFGREHLPYAIITLAILCIFVFFPTLLLFLYPMKCFQRRLSCSQIKLRVLHTFTDAFQGCYKDGTNGTRDCRYFTAMYLMVRIILSALFVSTTSIMSLLWMIIVLFTFSTSIAVCQPYKPKYSIYNYIDIILILLLAAWLLSMIGIQLTSFAASTESDFLARKYTMLGLSFVTGLLPLLYFFYLILRWLCCCITLRYKNVSRYLQERTLQNSLPDRMVNPDHYSLYDLVDT